VGRRKSQKLMTSLKLEKYSPAGGHDIETKKAADGGPSQSSGSPLPDSGHVGGWKADLDFSVAAGSGRCGLGRLSFKGPLRIQRPFRPESGPNAPCHLYLLHPPGGMVGGDALTIKAEMEPGARALVTTPSAAKFYRAQAPQSQSTSVNVGPKAGIEWLPAETIVFSGANGLVETSFEVSNLGFLLGCEITVLGRPASGDGFERGVWHQIFNIKREGRLVLRDVWKSQGGGDELINPAGWAERHIAVMFYALGRHGEPTDLAALTAARNVLWQDMEKPKENRQPGLLPPQSRPPQSLAPIWGVTILGELFLAKMLTDSLTEAHRFRLKVWEALRPGLWQREVYVPDIWFT
jgi:urease accessory protein